MTALVHRLNNILKMFFVGRDAQHSPAALVSFLGAWVLIHLSGLPLIHYKILWYDFEVAPSWLSVLC